MVDLAKSLTDQLLERHLAKNRQPNVQQQLLDDLVLSQNSRVPLNQVEVDPTGTFSASSQTDLGIMNEGLGNIVNSFLNPTRVATARTNERNKLTQANSDRAYQQSMDRMNAQIAGDATQYSREQDQIQNAETFRSAFADETQKAHEFKVGQQNKLDELARAEAEKLRLAQTPAAQLKLLQEEQAKTDYTDNLSSDTLATEFLRDGGNPADTRNIINRMRDYGIPDSKLGEVQSRIAKQRDTITAPGMVPIRTEIEANIDRTKDIYEKQYAAPLQAKIDTLARENNITPAGLQMLGTAGDITTEADGMALITSMLESKEGQGIPISQMEDLSTAVRHALKQYGGLGFNSTILKNAVAQSLHQSNWMMNADVSETGVKQAIDDQMAAAGLGMSDLAGKRRGVIEELKGLTTGLADIKKKLDTEISAYKLQAENEGQALTLQNAYARDGGRGTPKTLTPFENTPLFSWLNKNKPKPYSTTAKDAADKILKTTPSAKTASVNVPTLDPYKGQVLSDAQQKQQAAFLEATTPSSIPLPTGNPNVKPALNQKTEDYFNQSLARRQSTKTNARADLEAEIAKLEAETNPSHLALKLLTDKKKELKEMLKK